MITCERCRSTGYPKYVESTVRCPHCDGPVRPATPAEVRRPEPGVVQEGGE